MIAELPSVSATSFRVLIQSGPGATTQTVLVHGKEAQRRIGLN